MSSALVRHAALGAASLVAIAACATDADTCGELRSHLQRCGLSARSLSCDRVDTSTLQYVVKTFSESGCEGAGRSDGTVDPRLCTIAGWSCPSPPTPEPTAARPAGAMVLVSGIDESPVFDWNPRILASLRAELGDDAAHHVKLPGWSTVPERAAELWSQVESIHERTGRKVNLVCYAVSGLDCRWLVSPKGLFDGDKGMLAKSHEAVASITTIATPHRGTRVADAALAALESGTAKDILSALGGGATDALPKGGALQRTLEGLTMDRALDFNARAVDAEGVAYFSFAGVSHVMGRSSSATDADVAKYCVDREGRSLYFRTERANDVMNDALIVTAPWSGTSRGEDGKVVNSPSDGMVSVASATWGELLGCVPADHYDVIGQIGKTTRDPASGFDAPRFYRWIASTLASRGL